VKYITIMRYRLNFLIIGAAVLLLCLCGCLPSQASLPETAQAEPAAAEPENHPPLIYYIESGQQEGSLEEFQLRCVASDPDGDTLYYSWHADEGTFRNSGESITWIAPQPSGTYTISVTASDGKGGEATDSVTVTVEPENTDHAPTVKLIIDRKDRPQVVITDEVYEPITVSRWSTVYIQCIAEDPDGDPLTYEWTRTKGKLLGEGPSVQYISTDTGGQSVTVTVSDGRGRYVRRIIHFDIPCCGRG
jgi:hypothetical protein